MFLIEGFLYSDILFQFTLIGYILAFLAYHFFSFNEQTILLKNPSMKHLSKLRYFATGLLVVVTILNLVMFVNNWIDAGRPPFRTFYESFLYLTLLVSTVYLGVEYWLKSRILGKWVILSILLVFVYALYLRDTDKDPIPPALQTWLFIPHVTAYFIGYAVFFIAFIGALMYPKISKLFLAGLFIIPVIVFIPINMMLAYIYMAFAATIFLIIGLIYLNKKVKTYLQEKHEAGKLSKTSIPALFLMGPRWFVKENVNLTDSIYPLVKFGFLFLTFGLLLGSYWGQVAWNNYWGWDQKENWALVSWFAFISYFHFKHIKGWDNKRLAWLVIIGFMAVVFTYLGMKYLPTAMQSLHTYTADSA